MKNRLMSSMFGFVVFAFSTVVLAQTAQAQAIPRTTDGKPDLSGTWTGGGDTSGGVFAGQHSGKGTMELTKWGRDKFNWNRSPEAANNPGVYRGQHARVDQDPVYHCYPAGLVRLGPPRDMFSLGSGRRGVIEIIQTTGKVIILFQFQHEVRQIYTDGREHPKNLELTWNGHSIGRWDGDTLVVDTVSIDPLNSYGGFIHTDALHMVERVRRVDHNMLEIVVTVDDPKAYTKPWTFGPIIYILRPDSRIEERVWCNDRYEKGIWYGE